MNPELVKLLLALAIFIIGFIGGSLPWIIQPLHQGGRFMALGNTFAAGVLGGVGLIHLLGSGIDGLRLAAPGMQYPLALFLTGVSFLFMLLIEKVIIGDHHQIRAGDVHIGSLHEIPPSLFLDVKHTNALILLVVLSLHSLILGLTLGAQQTLSGITLVFFSIIAHKLFAGFALGVGYKRAGFSWKQACGWLTFFAVMVPAGILLATITGALLSKSIGIWFEAVFDSIGAGTFLYIASVDIIDTEFHEPEAGDRRLKWLLTVAGFSVMAVLAVWV